MSALLHTLRLRFLAAVLMLGGCACGDDDDDTTPPPPDAGPDAPAREDAGGPDAGVDAAVDAGPEPLDLSRWCGDDDPATRREDAYLGAPVGQRLLGIFDGLPAGTLETMKFIPEHLLALTEIEIAFGRGGGAVRIHPRRRRWCGWTRTRTATSTC